jgi:phage/conjugal plasmid C-4 type zinc finger TraR family protein
MKVSFCEFKRLFAPPWPHNRIYPEGMTYLLRALTFAPLILTAKQGAKGVFGPSIMVNAPFRTCLSNSAHIDASVDEAVSLARSRLPAGEGLTHCEECGEPIPEARRKALPGVRLCVECQSELEKAQRPISHINRRGSKDSQLK